MTVKNAMKKVLALAAAAVMLAGGAVAFIAGVISLFRAAKKQKALRKQEEEWANG